MANLDRIKARICPIVGNGKGICLKAPSDTERLMTPTGLVGVRIPYQKLGTRPFVAKAAIAALMRRDSL